MIPWALAGEGGHETIGRVTAAPLDPAVCPYNLPHVHTRGVEGEGGRRVRGKGKGKPTTEVEEWERNGGDIVRKKERRECETNEEAEAEKETERAYRQRVKKEKTQ